MADKTQKQAAALLPDESLPDLLSNKSSPDLLSNESSPDLLCNESLPDLLCNESLPDLLSNILSPKLLLEVCVDSVESALAAQSGGADRIELCADLIIGGTTPSEALFRMVRKMVSVPIHVMVRPRYGDFLYTDYEFQVMQDNVRSFRELGADGIVTGFLKQNGSLDTLRMQQVREACAGMNLILHRAFDMTGDPIKAISDAIQCGTDIVLTSGQKENAVEGIPLLRNLEKSFGSQIQIMAGSGVSADNISLIHKTAGIRNFHLSGKTEIPSGMQFRNNSVSMGIPGFSEYSIIRTAEERVRAAAEICHFSK